MLVTFVGNEANSWKVLKKSLNFWPRKSVKTNCLLLVPPIGSRRNETVNGRAEQRGFQR